MTVEDVIERLKGLPLDAKFKVEIMTSTGIVIGEPFDSGYIFATEVDEKRRVTVQCDENYT